MFCFVHVVSLYRTVYEKVVAVVVEEAVESMPVQDSDHNEESTILAIKTS